MGKRRRGKKFTIVGQFTYRHLEMLESPPWRVLSLSARRVLDRIEIELCHHAGNDNGKLIVTFQNFVEYGIDRTCIFPAIQECVALGFLKVTEQGFAGIGEHRSPNKFRLTYRPADGIDGDGSHEWRLFGTVEEAMHVAKQARQIKPDRDWRPKKRHDKQFFQ